MSGWRVGTGGVLFAVWTVIAISGCAPESKPENHDDGIPVYANGVQFSSEVDAGQRLALQKAMSIIHFVPVTTASDEITSLLKLKSTDPDSLQSWLEQRVQFIVNEEFSRSMSVRVTKNAQFENPGELPDVMVGQQVNAARPAVAESYLIMANMGAFYYAKAKIYSELYSITLPGLPMFNLTSPRVGLLAIGDGMFKVHQDWSPLARAISNAKTLFHEARHSDGHGKSLGFMHAVCPAGHAYANEPACDLVKNGAYTVGAVVLKGLMKSCAQCSEVDRANLEVMYLDNTRRLISAEYNVQGKIVRHVPSEEWDDAPEGRR